MEEMIKSLQAEISRLNTELGQVRAEARKYRVAKKGVSEENNSLKSEHEKVLQERDALKTRLDAAPSDLQKELDRMKGEIRTRDHRQAFEKIAKEAKVRPEALNDLWQLAGIKPETDTVDEEGLSNLISEAVQARPYLLSQDAPEQPQKAQEQPNRLNVGTGYGRGGEPRRFVVSPENLADGNWMKTNQSRLVEAHRDGTVVYSNGRA